MEKIILTVLLVGLLVTGCSTDTEMNIKTHEPAVVDVSTISVDDVKNIVDNYEDYENVIIIDVRTATEYDEGHIEGAINLPLDIIENIDISKENKIIVYCQSGRRSNLAAIELIKLGYEEVFDMGGIQDWPYDITE